jgi:hypothetical protein
MRRAPVSWAIGATTSRDHGLLSLSRSGCVRAGAAPAPNSPKTEPREDLPKGTQPDEGGSWYPRLAENRRITDAQRPYPNFSMRSKCFTDSFLGSFASFWRRQKEDRPTARTPAAPLSKVQAAQGQIGWRGSGQSPASRVLPRLIPAGRYHSDYRLAGSMAGFSATTTIRPESSSKGS